MKTYQKTIKALRLVIEHDDYTTSPRGWSNAGVFITKESKYLSPDGTNNDFYQAMVDVSEYNNAQEHADAIKKQLETLGHNVLYIVPVSRYEHGNVVYKRGVHNGWDSGVCGFYIITKKKWDVHVGGDFTEDHANKLIDGELEAYTNYANGEVYQFTLYDEHGEVVDSCGGFYDIEDIREYLPEEWAKEDLQEYFKN